MLSFISIAASVSLCAHLQAQVLEVTKQRDDALENVTKLQEENQVLKVNVGLHCHFLLVNPCSCMDVSCICVLINCGC